MRSESCKVGISDQVLFSNMNNTLLREEKKIKSVFIDITCIYVPRSENYTNHAPLRRIDGTKSTPASYYIGS